MTTPPRLSSGLEMLPGIGTIAWRATDTMLSSGRMSARVLTEARYAESGRPVEDETHLARLRAALGAQ